MREHILLRLHYQLLLGFSLVLIPALALISLYTQISTRDILISRAHDEQMRLATTRALDVASQPIFDSQPGGMILGVDDSPDAFTTYYEVRLPDQDTLAWVVIYDRPITDILAPINQALLVNIALTAALLVVGLFIAYLLTRSIVRPLRALATAAEGVGGGDLSAPIASDSRDEIGALARTLDRDDLAERRLSEQAQMRLLAILEATTDVIGSADIRGRLLFLNSAGRRILGLDAHADITGLPIRSFVPDDSLSQILTVGAPAAIRDGIWSGELTLRGKDGNEIPTSQVIIAHRDAEGNPEYFSTIVRDISERLRAEEQLRQAQKMEAVGRLAGGVSHDFNNILTVIMGECDLMLHGPELSPELREGITQIHQAGTRAAALTRQLLAFSRRQVLQPTTINLNTIIIPIEQMVRRLIGEDVTLQTDLADNLATVRADPSQIEQVILNLCINGRDAMPQGGKLSITTANVAIAEGDDHNLRPGNYVLLTVHDTGSGIEESAREHIFEPFFTTKPRGKGTGLGLATVHGIVQQSGGEIFFSSALGQGTSFHVYLPAMAGPSAAAHAPARAHPPIAHAAVLLVEDDDRVRRLARQIMADHGLTVIEAADGAGAIRVCTQHQGQIDLLLSDIVMPGGISGVQLAARIRADRPTIKTILMSGYTDNALARAGSIAPETHFLQKPFSAADLLEKVYAALAIEA